MRFPRIFGQHRREVNKLTVLNTKLQHFNSMLVRDFDPLTGSVGGGGYNGNPYKSYETQVTATANMYDGFADWGCQQVKSIIDARAALTAGSGVQPKVTDVVENEGGAKKELEWVRKFVQFNGLQGKTGVEWAKEAEIEGKCLAKLSLDRKFGQIVVRFIPWSQRSYTVHTDTDDYEHYTGVEFHDEGKKVSWGEDDFVYTKFGGRINNPNISPTKIGVVLGKIEALDKALRDLREVNHLFASPTPTFECEDKNAAEELYDMLESIKWTIGKMLVVGAAKYKMVGVDLAAVETLEREITINAKIVSGAVGLPVHFLGFPELMSNRSTADSSMEMVFSSVHRERETWVKFYTELFRKAIVMSNKYLNTTLDGDKVCAEIPHSSNTKMRQVIEFWMELADRDAISKETLVEQIPGIDAQQELNRLKKEKKEAEADLIDGLRNSKNPAPPKDQKTLDENRLGRPAERNSD